MTATAKRRTSSGSVRIIGGQWKRTPLPVGDAPGLRPTPDRVRGTLFNWLVHAFGDLAGHSFLDLFAGTGALGFEAASRGGGPVMLVDRDPRTVASLRAMQAKLGATQVDIREVEAVKCVRQLLAADRRFDVVFLDPPFAPCALDEVLPLAARLCGLDGLLYVEAGTRLPEALPAAVGFDLYRADRAGEVFYHLLRRKKTE